MIIYNDTQLKAIDKQLQCLVIVDDYVTVYRIVDGKTDYIGWRVANFTAQQTKSEYKKAEQVMEWLNSLEWRNERDFM